MEEKIESPDRASLGLTAMLGTGGHANYTMLGRKDMLAVGISEEIDNKAWSGYNPTSSFSIGFRVRVAARPEDPNAPVKNLHPPEFTVEEIQQAFPNMPFSSLDVIRGSFVIALLPVKHHSFDYDIDKMMAFLNENGFVPLMQNLEKVAGIELSSKDGYLDYLDKTIRYELRHMKPPEPVAKQDAPADILKFPTLETTDTEDGDDVVDS